jgi:predicted Zn-dependent protease
LVCVVVIATLGLSADYLTKYIPFHYEEALFSEQAEQFSGPHEYDRVLQPLANDIAAAMDLPDGMHIRVHYVDEDQVNASATLGGHVVIYRGLVEQLPHENALAMVLAHEIAHVKHRHPIRMLGRSVVVVLALMAIVGVQGDDLAASVMGDAGVLTLLTFSRAQESEADYTALETVARVYGHVAGATDLYDVLIEEQQRKGIDAPVFLSTHPLTDDRISALRALQVKRGWDAAAPTTPLPILEPG